jgi:hypothetical protein
MVRDESAALWSNSLSTPVVAGQDRGFREAYVKALGSAHSGAHELRFGLEADFASLRETFGFALTDPDRFDRETPGEFAFRDRAQNREQAGFAQDLIRLGHWTFSAGLRWDHYRLLVDESAWSPRLGAAWYWEGGDVVFRASYDRVFQTPAFENILLADSDAAAVLGGEVLRLPVRPSRANFFEAGFSKALLGKFRVDANWFRRDFTHYADDELLLNTGVSFPIAFRKAGVTGAEVKVEIPRWGRLSGFAGYSNLRGTGYLPVTGGLFLGEEAAEAAEPGAGHFPISQDQRNTVSGRFRYQLLPRLWLAFGGQYGSGLPVEFTGTRADALQQYGARTVGQVDFERGRVRPNLSLVEHEHATARLQVDVRNLSNHFNLINFSGLFSGTALAAPRSVSARLQVDF